MICTDVAIVKYRVHMVSTSQNFGLWFSRQLKHRGMSQADFHHKSGVARSTVSAWARGMRVPDPLNCDTIADVLGVQLDLVLFMAGHRPNIDEIDPNDPRVGLIAKLERVRIDGEKYWRVRTLDRLLSDMINEDREG